MESDKQERGVAVRNRIYMEITNRCNLCCDYCYEHHKGNEVMSLDTGKRIVDMLIQMWLDDKPGAFINRAKTDANADENPASITPVPL